MAARDPTEQVQLKIRLRELLLARLAAEAKKYGYPLQTEITRRLEQSINDDVTGRVVFGSEERFGVLAAIDRLILAIEMQTRKDWSDRETRYMIADAVSSFIPDSPDEMASGQLRVPIPVFRSSPYAGPDSRVLTDPTGERRKQQFHEHFRGLRSYRPNPSGESGFIKHGPEIAAAILGGTAPSPAALLRRERRAPHSHRRSLTPNLATVPRVWLTTQQGR